MRIDTLDTLVSLNMIKSGMNVLDVGCGPGNWAVDFIERGYKLNYIGIDNQVACKKVFEEKVTDPSYKFITIDAQAAYYNWMGKMLSKDVVFPIEDDWADLVVCHSLFTHLGKFANSKNYISEIKRILKSGAYLWITFFQSPPNLVDNSIRRTVYSCEQIGEIMDGFDIFYKNGGDTDGYNDQLMIGARKL